MANLEPPFLGENLISLGYNIVNKPAKPLNSIYSEKLANFINNLLEKNPGKRPRISDLLREINTHLIRKSYNNILSKEEQKGKVEVGNQKEYFLMKQNILKERETKFKPYFLEKNNKKQESSEEKLFFKREKEKRIEIENPIEKNEQDDIQEAVKLENELTNIKMSEKSPKKEPLIKNSTPISIKNFDFSPIKKENLENKNEEFNEKNLKYQKKIKKNSSIFGLKNPKNINSFQIHNESNSIQRLRPMSANFKPKFRTSEKFFENIRERIPENKEKEEKNTKKESENNTNINVNKTPSTVDANSFPILLRPKSAMLPYKNLANKVEVLKKETNQKNITDGEEIRFFNRNIATTRPQTAFVKGERNIKKKLTIYDLF